MKVVGLANTNVASAAIYEETLVTCPGIILTPSAA